MKHSKKTWIITFLIIIIVFGGFYGMIFNKITQSDIASKQAWWFLIPSIPVAIYYAYKATFSYYPNLALWRNLLGTIICTTFFALVLVKSFQGYLYIYNCSFGLQKVFTLKGSINYVNKPKYAGRIFSIYTINVTLDSSEKSIKLDTKTNTYKVGQRLELNMKTGSLGYIYLPK